MINLKESITLRIQSPDDSTRLKVEVEKVVLGQDEALRVDEHNVHIPAPTSIFFRFVMTSSQFHAVICGQAFF